MGPGVDGFCNNGWRQGHVYYVAWLTARAWTIPEIYRTDGVQAKQWQQLSYYGKLNYGNAGVIMFKGAMTQQGACQQKKNCAGPPRTDNSPSAGWRQLYSEINCFGAANCQTASTVPSVTDIKWAK